MDIDQPQQIRYDRQIRLWGNEGQLSIQQARICIFGSSALAAEILKSLVLAGIGSFHIIDATIVTEADLGQNFFIEKEAIGKQRGECLVKLLTELNPSVHGQHSAISFREFSKHDLQMLLQFSIVISTSMPTNEAVQLDHFLFENNIPFVYARIYGMLGFLRLSLREHIIWNNHSENDPYDLRLDSPFPELLKLANETNFDMMTHEQHSHTPYVLLYFKALDIWRKRHQINQNNEEQMDSEGIDSTFPNIYDYKTRKELEAILKEMRMPDQKGNIDEENFAEAIRNLLKGMQRSKVPENVEKVLNDPKSGRLPAQSNIPLQGEYINVFWILCAALREFIDRNQQMPISGQLPDMASDSKRYVQLLSIYRNKSQSDAAQLQKLANEILKQRRSALYSNASSSSTSYEPFSDVNTATSETDDSTQDETDDDELSRMSTTDAANENEQKIISLSMESMEGSCNSGSSRKRNQPSGGSNKCESPNALILKYLPSNNHQGETEFDSISIEQCQEFCKNAAHIGIQYGSSLSSEFTSNIKSVLQEIDESPQFDVDKQKPPVVNPLTWYILLRAVDRFRAANDRLPMEDSDIRDLKRCLTELFVETRDTEIVGRQNELIPSEILHEICRYGASEPHVIAAILGGTVAQEVIKLSTHQYIPVDNSLIFDGHSQQARTFRIKKH